MTLSRTLVTLFAIVFGLFAVPQWPLRSEQLVSASMQEPAKVITILHTNDIHGHLMPWQGWEGARRGQTVGGFATLATQVRRIRAEKGHDRVVLLDAGDTIGDTMIAVETRGGALLSSPNRSLSRSSSNWVDNGCCAARVLLLLHPRPALNSWPRAGRS